jgi:glycosyltransferase 2 family protein
MDPEQRVSSRGTFRSRLARPPTAAVPWIGIALAAAFAYFAIHNVRFADVWHGLRTSNYWWLLPAYATLAVAVFVRGLRWRYLFARETRPPMDPVMRALLIGYFFNSVLPGRPGEAAQVVALSRRAGTSLAEAGATAVLARVYDVLCLLLLLFATAPWLPSVSWLHTAVVLGVVLASMLVLAIAILGIWGLRPLHFMLKPLHRLPFLSSERIEHIGENLGQGLAALRRPRLIVAAFAWTTLGWLVLALSMWFVMRGFHFGLSFIAALLVVIAVNLAQILPAPPSAIGVYEAAVLVALRPYDVSDSRALSYALVVHALNFLPFIVAGLLVLRGTLWTRPIQHVVHSEE